jgi:mono/diheme cytochrome c family protein
MNTKINSKLSKAGILYGFILLVLIHFLPSNSILAHGWKAPKEAAKKANPVELTMKSVQKGKETYLDVCSNCHGDNVKGGDPKEFMGQKTPPNLILRLKHHSDGDFFWKIQNGKDDMPSFEEDLEPSEIWDIINFIKSQG